MAESEVLVIFKGQDRTLSKVAGSVGGSFTKLQGVVKSSMLGGVTAIAGLGAATIGLGSQLIGLGSDAEEMQGKFNVVFANTGDRVTAALDDFATLVGRSKFELREMASVFGDTLKPMGFTEDAAADFSVQLTQLATDLSSFNNMPMDEAMQRLQGTLIGNHENALAFGTIINENTLKAELARMGADGLTGAMLEQAKVQARMNLLMAGTTDAQGDALRTSGSWANQMRRLKSTLTDAATELGVKLLPSLTPVLSMIGEMATNAVPRLIDIFNRALPVVQDISGFIRGFFSELRNGSDPLTAIIDSIFTWTQFGEENGDMLEKIANVIEQRIVPKVTEMKDRVIEFFEPIKQWIQNNIQLKDVLIGLAIILGGVVLSAIISVITAIAPIVILVGAIIGAVALLRTAWEENWGGIQEKTAAFMEFILPKIEELKLWIQENLPIAIETLRGWWEDTLLPALQRVGDWLQNTLIPFLRDTLAPFLSENIPVALKLMKDEWDKVLENLKIIWDFLTSDMLPIWESLADLLNTAVTVALTALQGVWENVLLPALEKVWQFIKDKLEPVFNRFKGGAVDPLKESLAGLGDIIQNVSDFLDGLTDRLENIELPDWMTPGSPTPWEIGLKGVRTQLQGLSTGDLPQFNNALQQTGNSTVTNNRIINQNTTINTSSVDLRSESRTALQFATGGT